MADNYKEYLAAKVLADGKPITYRVLSRALKVNVNIAKQMLYEFHSQQNAKKPKSVHATYVLAGKKRAPEHTNGVHTQDGEDSFMHSSPYMSSMPEQEPTVEELVPHTSIVLVPEEGLEKLREEFEDVTSTHVYSLEPGPIENMNLLSICNQDMTKDCAGENPLDRWKTYGSIHNPYRRIAKFAPAPVPAASKPTVSALSKEEEAKLLARRGSVSEDNTSAMSTPQPTPSSSALKKSNSRPNLKRDNSDIFKSFAKAKAKPKAAEKLKEPTPPPVEDGTFLCPPIALHAKVLSESMEGMSEDEDDDNDPPEITFDAEKAASAHEEMLDAPQAEEKGSQDSPIDKEPSVDTAEREVVVTSQGGRRRGRRRVMRKKKVKDEEDYLVIKEEAVWESFSEDEPEPKKPKPVPSKPATTAKGKKTGMQGQGNIASFFKKA
ncbi:uncharacterized protein BDR25DRAFT_332677 [Lindgomyces ingoldianus]|uniref:Uncharacterized protein n=1 Tax=Lindgomyces ingoldianus TaxID=673940 RepID=A0ACB6R3V9_9PLEO|nr:uncharacterized protein BDR25DRAFT_332677 [Lindgomyces ingoldianus]KAF2473939.1 hypothetical protein BDR25DRAFT_332677 [Lindgomyces ingoldianus]